MFSRIYKFALFRGKIGIKKTEKNKNIYINKKYLKFKYF